MKFFALKQFSRVCGLEVKDPNPSEIVHKGAVVSIGGDRSFECLNEDLQRLVVELRWDGLICDAEDFQKVDLLKREIAQELKELRRKEQARRQSQSTRTGQRSSILDRTIPPIQPAPERPA